MPIQSGKFEVPHVVEEIKEVNVDKVTEEVKKGEAADTVAAELAGEVKAEDKEEVIEKTEDSPKKEKSTFTSWIKQQKKKVASLKRKPKTDEETESGDGVQNSDVKSTTEEKIAEPAEAAAEPTVVTTSEPAVNGVSDEVSNKDEVHSETGKKNKISSFFEIIRRKASKREVKTVENKDATTEETVEKTPADSPVPEVAAKEEEPSKPTEETPKTETIPTPAGDVSESVEQPQQPSEPEAAST